MRAPDYKPGTRVRVETYREIAGRVREAKASGVVIDRRPIPVRACLGWESVTIGGRTVRRERLSKDKTVLSGIRYYFVRMDDTGAVECLNPERVRREWNWTQR